MQVKKMIQIELNLNNLSSSINKKLNNLNANKILKNNVISI